MLVFVGGLSEGLVTKDSKMVCFAFIFIGFSVLGCEPSERKRHPVRGLVRVNGVPAERVIVQMHCVNRGSKEGNDRYPSALTGADGRFEIGKGSERLGALEGEYIVTFSWLSGPELGATDKLAGRFADPKSSKFRIEVPVDQDRTLDFDLVVQLGK